VVLTNFGERFVHRQNKSRIRVKPRLFCNFQTLFGF
jgi:hypothetical protein